MKRAARRLLSRALHATLRRLSLPYRDVLPESYRFPWF
jgi:hypothetical protein